MDLKLRYVDFVLRATKLHRCDPLPVPPSPLPLSIVRQQKKVYVLLTGRLK